MSSVERLQVILNHLQHGSMQLATKRTAAKKYVYTWDNNLLSDDQREFYEKNGYIVIKKLIEDELIDEFKNRFIDLCTGKISKGNMVLMKDLSLMNTNAKGEYLYNKVQDIQWDEVFSKYILHPKLLEYLKCFIGPNISSVNFMLINKPPDSGKLTSTHPLHQDLLYFPIRPINGLITSWTAMETVTEKNGCLYVIPGTHKATFQDHGYPDDLEVNKFYYGIQGFDLVPRQNLIMEKGDTVFFHHNLLHGSGPNLTKGFRKCISCQYASNDCHFIDLKNTKHETVCNEVVEMNRKKLINTTFQEFIQLKLRIISGKPGPLNIIQSPSSL